MNMGTQNIPFEYAPERKSRANADPDSRRRAAASDLDPRKAEERKLQPLRTKVYNMFLRSRV